MKKEEILEKSRNEKRDEGKEYVFDKGRKSGFFGMLVIFCILAVFNLYTNRQETNSALIAVMFGYLGCEGLGMYSVTKKKMHLLNFIAGSIIGISFLGVYLYRVSS
ncbi:DUF6442 family protein [Paenibacillus tuaregi]|uniref:DUF6442 family protein n=1 Tax=Paenibacillus tuaregi TaxID=1816681 RepID=UPI000838BFFE|nr:DUF6442 family protein [Paenibacillus tuaregi]